MHNRQINAQGSLIYIMHEKAYKYQIEVNTMISVRNTTCRNQFD
jgi:hypothetical protein